MDVSTSGGEFMVGNSFFLIFFFKVEEAFNMHAPPPAEASMASAPPQGEAPLPVVNFF